MPNGGTIAPNRASTDATTPALVGKSSRLQSMSPRYAYQVISGASLPRGATPSRPYLRRVLDDELDALLPELSAIAIDGPKGVGKTATAMNHARTVHRLDNPETLQLIGADPAQLTTGQVPILIDEHQRWQPSWDLARRAVDEDPAPAGGSCSPDRRRRGICRPTPGPGGS